MVTGNHFYFQIFGIIFSNNVGYISLWYVYQEPIYGLGPLD